MRKKEEETRRLYRENWQRDGETSSSKLGGREEAGKFSLSRRETRAEFVASPPLASRDPPPISARMIQAVTGAPGTDFLSLDPILPTYYYY